MNENANHNRGVRICNSPEGGWIVEFVTLGNGASVEHVMRVHEDVAFHGLKVNHLIEGWLAGVTPLQLEADEPVVKIRYIVAVLGYWGRGSTIGEAAEACLKAGGMVGDRVAVWQLVMHRADDDAYIDRDGNICYPHDGYKHTLISQADGQRVTLGSLVEQKPKKGG